VQSYLEKREERYETSIARRELDCLVADRLALLLRMIAVLLQRFFSESITVSNISFGLLSHIPTQSWIVSCIE
jgi:hypothetical protein